MNAIELHNVSKKLGTFQLSLPTLTVPEGFVTGFIGENGSGKTTTIKLIMAMLLADSGTITIFGQPVPADATAIKQQIGYMGDPMGFTEKLSLCQLKKSIAPFYTQWDEDLHQRYLRLFQLDDQKTYASLSKGMKKQFDLIMALSHHPRLLILDEPTANLDPLAREQLLRILTEQVAVENVSIFFSSHITGDLDKIADYIIFLHQGQILLEDTKDHLLDTYRLVRGKRELLVPEVAQTLLYIEESHFNFEALSTNWQETYALLGDEALYEKATLENIFIAYVSLKRKQEVD